MFHSTRISSKTGSLYRGWTAGLLGAAIHSGIYFGVYDSAKGFMSHINTTPTGANAVPFFFLRFAIGSFATTVALWARYPFDVGIVRAQAAVAPTTSLNGVTSTAVYSGALGAMMKVAKYEGIGALWRGYGLSIAAAGTGGLMLIFYDMIRT